MPRKKKHSTWYYELHSDVWQDYIQLYFSDNIDIAWIEILKKDGLSPEAYPLVPNSVATVYTIGNTIYALFHIEADNLTIVHECCHLTYHSLKPRLISHNDETDEVYAYTTEFFFKKITEIRDSLPKKKK